MQPLAEAVTVATQRVQLLMEQGQLLAPVGRLLSANKVIGFNTYGEQFGTMHMSQTFTGIAFGGHR